MEMFPIFDNGHGADTAGKRSPKLSGKTFMFEYEFNRDIVKRITRKLDVINKKYHILVPEPNDITLVERKNRANKLQREKGNTYLISIHADAHEILYIDKQCTIPYNVKIHGLGVSLYRKEELQWTTANGFSVWTTKGKTRSDKLADLAINSILKENIGIRLRSQEEDGDKDSEADFYILHKTSMPAILIECGFMTNAVECAMLKDPIYRDKIADAIVDLVLTVDKEGI